MLPGGRRPYLEGTPALPQWCYRGCMSLLRRILDRYERVVDRHLVAVSERYGARVFPKVRIADVTEIDSQSLTWRHRQYALMAHFDFVVADADHCRG